MHQSQLKRFDAKPAAEAELSGQIGQMNESTVSRNGTTFKQRRKASWLPTCSIAPRALKELCAALEEGK
jgi:hypothetical protein